MRYLLLADILVLLHLTFVAFVVTGGLLVVRWPRLAWVHLSVAAWGALVELGGWVCPVTPFEVRLRILGGQAGYSGGFVEHYLLPILYPSGLTRGHQVALGLLVVLGNVGVYGWAWRRWNRPRQGREGVNPAGGVPDEERHR